MHLLIIVVVAIVGLMVFSTVARRSIVNGLTAAGYVAQGVWARRPTARAVLRYAAIPVILMVVPWVIFYFLMASYGADFNAPTAGKWIGFLFPIWSFTFLLRRIPVLGRIVVVPHWIASAVLVVMIPIFLFGMWSPEVKAGYDRMSNGKKSVLADFFNTSAVQDEGRPGKIGRIDRVGVVGYTSAGYAYMPLGVGTKVRLIPETKGFKPTPGSEGMVQVMIANQNGDFVNGPTTFVPPRNINWDWEESEARAKAQAEEANRLRERAQASERRQAVAPPPAPQREQVIVREVERPIQETARTERQARQTQGERKMKLVAYYPAGTLSQWANVVLTKNYIRINWYQDDPRESGRIICTGEGSGNRFSGTCQKTGHMTRNFTLSPSSSGFEGEIECSGGQKATLALERV